MSSSGSARRPPAAGAASARAPAARRPPSAVPAFVLHQWDWSETSLILDLFTRGRGRLAAVAKGAKRPYSQLRPVLMPFQRVLVTLGKGAGGDEGGDILTLRAAEYAGAGAVLPPARLMSGFYLNELLLKLLARGDAHEALFDAYADTLLAMVDEADEAPLRAFELVLLRRTGVLPELDRDTTTQAPLQPQRHYRLRPEAGLVPAEAGDDTALPAALCQALERGLNHPALAALRATCRAGLPALRQQLRPLLQHQLGSLPLRTRQLVLEARRLDERPAAASPAEHLAVDSAGAVAGAVGGAADGASVAPPAAASVAASAQAADTLAKP